MSKCAVITGTSSGIGQATAVRLLDNGYRIIGISRRPNVNIRHKYYSEFLCDLADLPQVSTCMKKISTENPDIDAVVLNAGSGRFGHLEQFSVDQIDTLIRLNLTSPLIVARHFVPRLKSRPLGNLVFIGSESALSGGARGSVYAATKFGLRGAAQSLRSECAASNLRITIINPGMVKSPFFDELSFEPDSSPEAHLLPDDVAGAVLQSLSSRLGAVYDEINISPQKTIVRHKK